MLCYKITICDDCGVVSEYIDKGVLDALSEVIANSGFAPSRHVIELQGVCENCGYEQKN